MIFSNIQSLWHRRNTENIMLVFHTFCGKWSNNLYSLRPPIHVFTIKIHLATFTRSNHLPSSGKKDTTQTSYSYEPLFWGIKSRVDTSTDTTILTLQVYLGFMSLFSQFTFGLIFGVVITKFQPVCSSASIRCISIYSSPNHQIRFKARSSPQRIMD